MKSLSTLTLVALLSAGTAMAVPVAPPAGKDDCYNRTSTYCNDAHPNNYNRRMKCVRERLDWCDINEPAAGSSFGRFGYRPSGRWQRILGGSSVVATPTSPSEPSPPHAQPVGPVVSPPSVVATPTTPSSPARPVLAGPARPILEQPANARQFYAYGRGRSDPR